MNKKESVIEKFGKEYTVDLDTLHMGIHHLLGDAVAKRFIGHKACLDACLGAGLMTIALAKYVDTVIGVDVDPAHLEQAKQNVKIASIEHRTNLIQGDIMDVLKMIQPIDSAFLDPDWARVGDNKENHVLSLSQMVPPADLLLEEVFKKTRNVCLRLPKTFDLRLLDGLPQHETESIFLDGKLKFYCVYFGDLIHTEGKSELNA